MCAAIVAQLVASCNDDHMAYEYLIRSVVVATRQLELIRTINYRDHTYWCLQLIQQAAIQQLISAAAAATITTIVAATIAAIIAATCVQRDSKVHNFT